MEKHCQQTTSLYFQLMQMQSHISRCYLNFYGKWKVVLRVKVMPFQELHHKIVESKYLRWNQTISGGKIEEEEDGRREMKEEKQPNRSITHIKERPNG